mmetsp:Transcript_148728/g.274612  ORF Transcript_148728/g.274612 Transcript_148728/m.274612 type:complete len:475 (-) Transcript_148728:30-1454(-)
MVRWRRITTAIALVITVIRATFLVALPGTDDAESCTTTVAPSASLESHVLQHEDEEVFSNLQTRLARPHAAKGKAGGSGAPHGSLDPAILVTRSGQMSPSEITFFVFLFSSIGSLLLLVSQILLGYTLTGLNSPVITHEREEDEHDDYDLDEDIYCAGIYSIIHDTQELFINTDGLSRRINIFRMVFILALLLGNLVGQTALLVWTYIFVVAPSVTKVQQLYQLFHRECYTTEGLFNETSFKTWPHKVDLCDICFSKFYFMLVCLALWSATMLWEHRKNDDLLWHLRNINRVEDFARMVERDEDGVERVKGLTAQVRWVLYLIVIVPKTAINLVLLICGTIWLVATTSFSNMILNAVALEFIINIDELCFGAMVPRTLRANMANFKLSTNAVKCKDSQIFWNYTRSICYICLVVMIPYCYMKHGQTLPLVGVYPGYVRGQIAQHCQAINRYSMYRVCIWQENCFPYGPSMIESK